MGASEHMRRYMANEIDVDEYIRLTKADVDADLEPMFERVRAAQRAALTEVAVWFFLVGAISGVIIGYALRWVGV